MRYGLIMARIAERDHLVLTEDDIDAAMNEEIIAHDGHATEIREFYAKDKAGALALRERTMEAMILDHVASLANTSDHSVPIVALLHGGENAD